MKNTYVQKYVSVFFVDAATFEIINRVTDTKTFHVTREKRRENKKAAYVLSVFGEMDLKLNKHYFTIMFIVFFLLMETRKDCSIFSNRS